MLSICTTGLWHLPVPDGPTDDAAASNEALPVCKMRLTYSTLRYCMNRAQSTPAHRMNALCKSEGLRPTCEAISFRVGCAFLSVFVYRKASAMCW